MQFILYVKSLLPSEHCNLGASWIECHRNISFGLKQNAPTNWMGFDICNGLTKNSETTWLHVLDIKGSASNRNAITCSRASANSKGKKCKLYNICRSSRHNTPTQVAEDYSTVCSQIKDAKCKCFQQMLGIFKAYVVHASLKEIAKTAVLVQIVWHLGTSLTFFMWK